MTPRSEIAALLRHLYDARVEGDLDAVCRLFGDAATFRIAGTGAHGGAVAVVAVGIDEIRQWLALLIKAFGLTDARILTMLVDGERAAVHWQTRIHSRISGLTTPTELIDLVETRDRRIAAYTEFLASA